MVITEQLVLNNVLSADMFYNCSQYGSSLCMKWTVGIIFILYLLFTLMNIGVIIHVLGTKHEFIREKYNLESVEPPL